MPVINIIAGLGSLHARGGRHCINFGANYLLDNRLLYGNGMGTIREEQYMNNDVSDKLSELRLVTMRV